MIGLYLYFEGLSNQIILNHNYTIHKHQERSSEASLTAASSTQTASIDKLVSTDYPTTTSPSSAATRPKNIPLLLEKQPHCMFAIFWSISWVLLVL